jgi:methylenetetrahydrofolate reductase (NADPH)
MNFSFILSMNFNSNTNRYIKANYGDYFCIGVAAYPEGHLECTSLEDDLKYLKEKVDAGASLIVTQLFYDNQRFIDFVKKCRAIGIPESVHILPGIMPVQNYNGFKKMTSFCKTFIPDELTEGLEQVKDDDAKVS